MCILACATGCHEAPSQPYRSVPGGRPERGAELIAEHCGSCHVVPGIRGATGHVGPPLTDIGQRTYIATSLLNTPENMIRWIVSPQAIDPSTAMPSVGVDVQGARDIAAYLYTLQDGALGPPHLLPASWLERLSEAGPL